MSCFIVSPKSLERIVRVAASTRHESFSDALHYAEPFLALGYNLRQSTERFRLAEDLFQNNVAAFCDRYPPYEDAPEGATTRYPEDLPEFRYSEPDPFTFCYHHRDELIQAHKSATCLHYQCCEGDIADRPLTKALEEFCQLVAEDVLVQSEEWQTAKWG